MSDPIFQDIGPENNVPLDFDSLKNYGIELIQNMAGNIWTDYNLHDPGITILDALCYAITDLAYQTDFDITDLLTDKDGKIDYAANSFFHKQNILTTNPVTVNDHRKAIIDDLDMVDNVWLTPINAATHINSISGLYKIQVQLDQGYIKRAGPDATNSKAVINDVRKSFVSKRSLCEDVSDITILKPVGIAIKAEIQIDAVVVAEVALANIYYALQLAINRPVKYSSERDLLQRGYTVDEIYSGPKLINGLIANEDLPDRLITIDANDLIQKISAIEGVVLVKSLLIARENTGKFVKLLTLDDTEVAHIDIDITTGAAALLDISLWVDKYRVSIRKSFFADNLQNVVKVGNREFIKLLQQPETLSGTYRNSTTYYSIQNYFPLVYGIGHEGLSRTVSNERKAQAKQLKGYLMIFEQVLANYLAQVNNLGALFSNAKATEYQSYFADPLYTVPNASDIILAFTDSKDADQGMDGWNTFKADKKNKYITQLNAALEADATRIDRKSRMLDHILARFNETAIFYPVTLYNLLYLDKPKTGRMMSEIEWRSSVLMEYDQINYNRVRGLNYLNSGDKEYDFATKMRKLLYIVDDNQGKLTAAFEPSKIKFETTAEKSPVKAQNNVDDESAWDPEMQRIILSREDVADKKKKNLIADTGLKYSDRFVFAGQDISVLRYAINVNNYRIAPDSDGSYMLLYKAPVDTVWNVVSRYPGSEPPIVGTIKKLTEYIINLSRRSEGFYIVEHLLLRPDLDIEVYGFQLYSVYEKEVEGEKRSIEKKLLFENKDWLSFDARAKAISQLLNYDPGNGFSIARSNSDLSEKNVAMLIDAKAWNGDVDAIDTLQKRAAGLSSLADDILNEAGHELANVKAHIAGINSSNDNTARHNKAIALSNKKIIDRLTDIARLGKTSKNIALSLNAREGARTQQKAELKSYSESVDKHLALANQQKTDADHAADVINRMIWSDLSSLGRVNTIDDTLYDALNNLFINIKRYGQRSYPRLKMLVKGKGESHINEDFFSFNMSVIFPEWPARFQDSGFKACVEGLFKYHAPANIKVNIIWVNISKMKRFEPLYATWKNNLLTGNNNYGAQHILDFLLKENNGERNDL